MSINIRIQKKDLWLLAAIGIFLVGIVYVIAYGGTQPSVHGHSAGEIEGSKIYNVQLNTLRNYQDLIGGCPNPGHQALSSGCNRYCGNRCKSGGVVNCVGTPDSGLNYVGGTSVELNCVDTPNMVECLCIN